MKHILTIIDKEWAEVFKNRAVLLTVIIMPIIFTILPLATLYGTSVSMDLTGDSTDVPAMFAKTCGDMQTGECLQVYIVNQFLLLYIMMPLAIPIAIAAYSIVGEKTTRSLEPLLATPIKTWELMVGKSAAAAIPAVAATIVCFIIFAIALRLMNISEAVRASLLGPTWWIGILVAGPLMAVASVILALMVSSRVNDPRAAEQISSVLIVPVMMLIFGQLAGLFTINVQVMLFFSLALLVVDVAMVLISARLFQRETILTRWK